MKTIKAMITEMLRIEQEYPEIHKLIWKIIGEKTIEGSYYELYGDVVLDGEKYRLRLTVPGKGIESFLVDTECSYVGGATSVKIVTNFMNRNTHVENNLVRDVSSEGEESARKTCVRLLQAFLASGSDAN